jgi:hypothetical protein
MMPGVSPPAVEPNETPQVAWPRLIARTTVVHVVTYFAVGWAASSLMGYQAWFEESRLSALMRPTSDRWVMAGPLFQPLRGALFGALFYLLRGPLFGGPRSWLITWAVLAGLGVLNTFGPAPGSIEGFVYTQLGPIDHLRALPEVLVQSLALAFLTHAWMRHPSKRWSWIMGTCFVLALALPVLGLLTSPRPD